MEKEQFDKLPVEQKFLIINMYLNIVKDATYIRMGLLPTISGLFTTFLVIATFNEKLIPLDNTVRVILSILIAFIPLSLYIYNFDLKKSGQKGEEYLEKLIGKANNTPTVKDKIIGHLPDVLIYIFTIISLIIIYKILGCFWSTCGNI